MPGGCVVRTQALERANEIKYPVGHEDDYVILREMVVPFLPPCTPIWLQPLSQDSRATALCLRLATEHGHRISLQTHKYLGVR